MSENAPFMPYQIQDYVRDWVRTKELSLELMDRRKMIERGRMQSALLHLARELKEETYEGWGGNYLKDPQAFHDKALAEHDAAKACGQYDRAYAVASVMNAVTRRQRAAGWGRRMSALRPHVSKDLKETWQ